MGMERRYPPKEYERVEGNPLPPARLAAIWAGLPERERLGFVLSLDEALADEVIACTIKYSAGAAGKGVNQ